MYGFLMVVFAAIVCGLVGFLATGAIIAVSG